jgi:hypothetical protein
MKRTKAPPSRLGPHKMVYSEDLEIDQIVWTDTEEPKPEPYPGSEREAARDLYKPAEQLLVDVHRENNMKRLASMMLRVVQSNNKLSRWVHVLAWVTATLAAIQALPTLCGWVLWLFHCRG